MLDWGHAILLLASGAMGADPAAWELCTQGEAWRMTVEPRPAFRRGRVEQALVVSFPGNTESQPGQFASASRTVARPEGERNALTFTVHDSFIGPTAGYHFLQARVNDQVVWEADAAGGSLAEATITVDVTEMVGDRPEITVTLGVWERQRVTNFPLEVVWTEVALEVDGTRRVALTEPVEVRYEPLPPDLPLPAAPPNLDWTPTANVVQPWGHTQRIAVAEHEPWAARLAEEFGFNAIIMLPPEAHNAITGEEDHVTEAEFQAALATYRRAGLRFILYSSIMHCGHAPAWQTGQLAREHPDWSQRDQHGNPVTVYGADWLCPSSPALDYTLRYTRDLVRRYGADAVMLDNQEFFYTEVGGPTCYCEHCQRKFRQYVRQRLGPEGVQRAFGLAVEELRIPTERGDLFNLWIHWRNRVWAEATEVFRAKLRETKPDLVLLTNTQYEFGDWLLATDLQYPHEDAVLSESRGLTSTGMSGKMQLGQALANGRPLWNYVGTFQEPDFTRLREAATIAPLLAATLAHRANPWIVFYGFAEHPPENEAALAELSRYLKFYRQHAADFAAAQPYAEVLSLLSLRARNYLQRPLQPAHLALLRAHHVPADTALETDLPARDLSGFRVIVAEGTACLSNAEAAALAAWVEAGGTLLATPDVGWYDEIGRLRGASVLWSHQDTPSPLTSHPSLRIGRGQVVGVETPEEILEVVAGLRASPVEAGLRASPAAALPPLVRLEPSVPEWEIVPYHLPATKRMIVHCLWHGPADAIPAARLTLRLPPGFTPTNAAWHWPGLEEPRTCSVDLDEKEYLLRLVLPNESLYAVLTLDGLE
jgi:hypothetical protein